VFVGRTVQHHARAEGRPGAGPQGTVGGAILESGFRSGPHHKQPREQQEGCEPSNGVASGGTWGTLRPTMKGGGAQAGIGPLPK